jgi:hypothetical protein
MAFTGLAKDKGLGSPGLIWGGINFGWLAVWVLNPDRLRRKLKFRELFQALR